MPLNENFVEQFFWKAGHCCLQSSIILQKNRNSMFISHFGHKAGFQLKTGAAEYFIMQQWLCISDWYLTLNQNFGQADNQEITAEIK